MDNYWANRQELRMAAQSHTISMKRKYPKEIAECVNRSVIYGEDARRPQKPFSGEGKTLLVFEPKDSVEAIVDAHNGKTAVLNFASYKNPGGMFVDGSSAQEESLCHESFLYNVLKEFSEYYEWNNNHKNKALYKNRAIYSPNVIFEKRGEQVLCDVITCAAPNKKAAQKYQNISDEANTTVLKSRARFIRAIAEENGVNTLILGAWGSGVFGQNPKEVAEILCNEFKNSSIDRVIFAVPDKKGIYFSKYCS